MASDDTGVYRLGWNYLIKDENILDETVNS